MPIVLLKVTRACTVICSRVMFSEAILMSWCGAASSHGIPCGGSAACFPRIAAPPMTSQERSQCSAQVASSTAAFPREGKPRGVLASQGFGVGKASKFNSETLNKWNCRAVVQSWETSECHRPAPELHLPTLRGGKNAHPVTEVQYTAQTSLLEQLTKSSSGFRDWALCDHYPVLQKTPGPPELEL